MFESKTLKKDASELLKKGYRQARAVAGNEMHLPKSEWEQLLPSECPWSLEQILHDEFLPRIDRKANSRRRSN
jgi:hypothetical protein